MAAFVFTDQEGKPAGGGEFCFYFRLSAWRFFKEVIHFHQGKAPVFVIRGNKCHQGSVLFITVFEVASHKVSLCCAGVFQ